MHDIDCRVCYLLTLCALYQEITNVEKSFFEKQQYRGKTAYSMQFIEIWLKIVSCMILIVSHAIGVLYQGITNIEIIRSFFEKQQYRGKTAYSMQFIEIWLKNVSCMILIVSHAIYLHFNFIPGYYKYRNYQKFF